MPRRPVFQPNPRRVLDIDQLYNDASETEWGGAVDRYTHAKQRTAPFGAGEIRWGDAQLQALPIPGAGTVTFGSFQQIIDVRETARRWCIQLVLEWLNANEASDPGDTVSATFIVLNGVGSGKATFFYNLSVNVSLNVNQVIIPVLPASTIVVTAQAGATALAAGVRTYNARVTALAAPDFRG